MNSIIANTRANIQIVRLSGGDVRYRTDHLSIFQNLILSNQSIYPEIEKWYWGKVLPGIQSSKRTAFVGYLQEKPIVSAVVKRGANSKFCHLRIHSDVQNQNLGEVFFSLMAFEIRDLAEEIHFTLPESVWQAKGDFFKSFGFNASLVSEKQYRLFDRELRCSARFSDVWTSVLDRVPKLSSYYSFGGVSPKGNIVLSIKPIFAERILSGKKRIEIRRKFSTRWVGHRLNLYSSAPEMSLVGEATISGVITGTPTEIWERFGTEIGCSKEEFLGYVKGASQIYAIELAEVRRYRSPISLAQMSFLARETLCPPQSYFALENNKPWSKAVSIAAYLHASLSTVVRTLYGCDRRLVETQPLGVQADFKLR